MHLQMLYPVVRVDAEGGKGSGTVIFSGPRAGAVETYVLTNWHVVAGSITVEKKWDSKEQKEIEKETRRTVEVFAFDYNDLSRNVGSVGKRAEIVLYDEKADVALLRLADKEAVLANIAVLLPEDTGLRIFERVWAVGAGLGHPPFATEGMIGHLDDEIDGYTYTFATAPIIFGNSGGALFHRSAERGRYELIGIPSRIRAGGFFLVVSHMRFSVSMTTIRKVLRDHCYGFLVGDATERTDCGKS